MVTSPHLLPQLTNCQIELNMLRKVVVRDKKKLIRIVTVLRTNPEESAEDKLARIHAILRGEHNEQSKR